MYKQELFIYLQTSNYINKCSTFMHKLQWWTFAIYKIEKHLNIELRNLHIIDSKEWKIGRLKGCPSFNILGCNVCIYNIGKL